MSANLADCRPDGPAEVSVALPPFLTHAYLMVGLAQIDPLPIVVLAMPGQGQSSPEEAPTPNPPASSSTGQSPPILDDAQVGGS